MKDYIETYCATCERNPKLKKKHSDKNHELRIRGMFTISREAIIK